MSVAMIALYLLPSVLGTLLQLAHGAEHSFSWSRDFAQATPRQAVVHSHDGSTHSHGPAVAILASALALEEGSEEDILETVPPVVLLAVVGLEPEPIDPPRWLEEGPIAHRRGGSPDPSTPPLPPPQG